MEWYFDDFVVPRVEQELGINFPLPDNGNFSGNLFSDEIAGFDDEIFLTSFLQDLPDADNLFLDRDFPSPDDCSSTLQVQFAGVSLPSEHSNESGRTSMETSVEESVLQEFQVLMAQLPDKARISFRDSFYRLAKNSKSSPIALKQNLPTLRHGWEKAIESKTNAIDRAIANLMFNKMETNMRDFPVMI